MNLPRLELSSSFAQIGMKVNRPSLSIKQPHADLQIKQDHAKLEITRSDGTLSIDQSEAFASVDSKSALRRSKDFFSKAKSHASQYVAKTAQQGDQMMKIENNGFGKFAQIAASDSQIMNHEVEMVLAPKPFSVKYNYQPGEFKISVKPTKVEIKVQKHDPQISIPKWKTDVYMQQKNKLTFQAVGLNVNRGI